MMNKLFRNKSWIAVVALLIFASCEVDQFEAVPLSSISVTNSAPGSPTVDVLVDGLVTSTNRLAYRTTSASKPGSSLIYLPLSAGERKITASPDTGKTAVAEVNMNFERGGIYSTFLYDTLVGGKLKALTLKDNLTLPATGSVHVRFLHLAPKAGPLDITFVRGTLYDDTTASSTSPARTFVPTDSVTISNRTYAGATPDAAVLGAFTPAAGSNGAAIARSLGFANVAAGSRNNRFRVKVKTAGTQTVLASIETTTLTLTAGKIYTFYVTGTAQNAPLTLNMMTNY